MSKTAAYMFESEFLEEQVALDVSNYLGGLSRRFGCGGRTRLLTSEECFTGADAQIPWRGATYFLQFKKPTGLHAVAVVPLPAKPRKNEAVTQQIRRFRSENDLADSPYSVCFQLRAMAKTASEFQHNLLHAYEKPPQSRAIYVCPTVTTNKEYEDALTVPWFHWVFERPFLLERYRFVVDDVAQWVEQAPFLRGHAAIVPHAKVDSAEHYYSFSRHASDVAFHSPEVVRRSVKRLSDFLATEIRAKFRDMERLPTLKDIAAALKEVAEGWAGHDLVRSEGETDGQWVQRHGALLQQRYGIHQFVMLTHTLPTPG